MQPQKKLTRKEKINTRPAEQGKGKTASKISEENKINFRFGFIIALIAFGLYANSIGNGFVYDDINVITRNHLVQEGMQSIPTLLTTSYRFGYFEGEDELYRPLPMIVFATLWQLFPDNPLPGHLLNVLLYALTAFFLFKLFRKLFSSYNIIVPFIATVLFIVHPVHTEVVANIKSLDEIMSFLLIIFSSLFFLRYVDNKVRKDLVYALCCFFAAILSKESAVMMIIVIPLTLYFFRNISIKKAATYSGMLFIPLLVYLLMRTSALGALTGTKHFPFIDNILVSAPDILTRLATVFLIFLQYIRLIFFPHPLSSDYSFKQFELTGWDNPLVIISFIFHIGIFLYALTGLQKKNIFSYCILFYLLTIFLSSNLFFVIGTAFAERFLYVPILGFTIGVSVLLSKLFNKENEFNHQVKGLSSMINSNKSVFIILLIVLIPMAYKTMARNQDWESDYILFGRDAKESPLSARSHFSFADNIVKDKILTSENDADRTFWIDSALAEYNRAIDIYPSYADAYGQRGFTYFIKGDKSKAFEDYRKGIDLKTNLETTYNNMGYLYSEKGEHQNALDFYKTSVSLNPRFIEAWRNLGSTYYALQDYDNAISAFTTAVKLSPDDVNLNNFLGSSYQAKGDFQSAQKYIDRANRLKGGN